MLSAEQNELLTRVGSGTPMGDLLRRYWYPVATCAEIKENPVKGVRLLGESLTLFKDRNNRLGLISQRCPHRGVDLKHGIPEDEGLRCPYHGWMYDTTGQCIEQPCEELENNFKDSVKLSSYPVEELGGLIWAYLGPEPVPLLPRWDLFVVDNAFRQIGTTVVPCNSLQCQENSVDTVHVEWCHGRFGLYALERQPGTADPRAIKRFKNIGLRHTKIDFEQTDIGIQKYRLRVGENEDAEGWRTGHPLVFPNYVRVGQVGYSEFQIRIPMDDTHTWHEHDGGRYLGTTAGIVTRDPVTGILNMGAYRVMIKDKNTLSWSRGLRGRNASSGPGGGDHILDNEKAGKATPVAIVMGMDPLLTLANGSASRTIRARCCARGRFSPGSSRRPVSPTSRRSISPRWDATAC